MIRYALRDVNTMNLQEHHQIQKGEKTMSTYIIHREFSNKQSADSAVSRAIRNHLKTSQQRESQ